MRREAGLIIVGGGQAGVQAAAACRSLGYRDSIYLICDEEAMPYQRPPLSKAFLLGKMDRKALSIQHGDFYKNKDICVITGRTVTQIIRAQKSIQLDDGSRLKYGTLLLALGARSTALPIEGSELGGVFSLRTLSDADAIRAALPGVRRVAVVGAGFIGLEFAAVASQLNIAVVVIEAADRVMARVVSPQLSRYFHTLHESNGVDIRLNAQVKRFHGDLGGHIQCVELEDGTGIDADMVIVGVGARANIELAVDSGLASTSGIHVDTRLRTADPSIFAIGDCATIVTSNGSQHIESVQNAVDQAKHFAQVMVNKLDTPYRTVPWFWSDQYSTKLQIAGITQECDTVVVRGEPHTGRFSYFFFHAGELVGAESINQPADHVHARRLIESRIPVAPSDVANTNIKLSDYGKVAVIAS